MAENHLKPWRQDMWCIPQIDANYVARMEDVLDLYAGAPDPKRPVACFDESPIQLIGEVRQPIPAKPGQIERYACEYRRNGTANLFVFLDVNRPWRKVKVKSAGSKRRDWSRNCAGLASASVGRTGSVKGRKSHAEANPALVVLVRQLGRRRPKSGQRSLREILAQLAARGFMNERGNAFSAASINSMLRAM